MVIIDGAENFSEWKKQYPECKFPKGPPIRQLIQLAIELFQTSPSIDHDRVSTSSSTGTSTSTCTCTSTSISNIYNGLLPDSILDVALSSGEPLEKKDIVSWDGVSTRWFLKTFLALPEVERLIAYRCPMWFLRYAGILVILHGRSLQRGLELPRGGSTLVDCVKEIFPAAASSTARFEQADETDNATKQATVFVSFTGSYSIQHFAAVIENSAQLQAEYLWIDTFCVNQFAWTQRKDEVMEAFNGDFMNDLRQQIDAISFTVLLLNQWSDLMEALGQIWVIWEIFVTVEGDKELKVLFSNVEHQQFIAKGMMAGTGGFENMRQSLMRIDVNRARGSAEDKKLILDEIRKNGGVSQINQRVIQQMREWFIDATTASLKEKEQEEGPDTLWLKSNLAILLFECGRYAESEPIFQQALEEKRQRFGDTHLETLDCLYNAACFAYHKGDLLQAEHRFRESLEELQNQLGNNHPDTLAALNNLAGILGDGNRLEEAESLYDQVLDLRRKQLGDAHSSTLISMNNFANLLLRQKKLTESENLFRQVLDTRRRELGDKHPDTMVSIHNMAIVQLKEEKWTEAESLFNEVLAARKEQLGNDHADTLASYFGLSTVYVASGELIKAIPMMTMALAGYAKTMGENHPQTVQVQNALLKVNEMLLSQLVEKVLGPMNTQMENASCGPLVFASEEGS